ncbi:ArsR/SmtB family transcription factor [Nitrospirillum viridazoti]|uniref:Transcriptional regulator n=1 Tax=Nitrospirillum viridazoti CBAmc TaxID=1441467 RepID=A0A248JQ45_9PROT|nr:helix-turn-helix transcriptional regulator [Nitrospirillum amazonense]ASG20873.1 transcriptional regulator [Nitrospirillum amazonense CBAmc]TWB37782.1 ArsR family transcriptional regulator [Nitrospirillum amazonense]
MTEAVAAANPATVFAALGDPTRLSLLSRLSDGHARSIAALSADTTLTRQAVTKHLHVLQDAGLVACVRVGRESRFAFQPEPVAAARGYLDAVSAQWDDALSRLRAFVKG